MGAASNASEAIQGAGKKQLVLSFVHLLLLLFSLLCQPSSPDVFLSFPFSYTRQHGIGTNKRKELRANFLHDLHTTGGEKKTP